MHIKFQLLTAFNSPAKVTSRRAIKAASWKAFALQNLHRRGRTLRILVLPSTGSTSQVLVCLSVREHWSSHWLLTLEHSTLLYWNLPLHSTSLLYTCLRPYGVRRYCLEPWLAPEYVRTYVRPLRSGWRHIANLCVPIASPVFLLAGHGWRSSGQWRTLGPCSTDSLQVCSGCSAGFSAESPLGSLEDTRWVPWVFMYTHTPSFQYDNVFCSR